MEFIGKSLDEMHQEYNRMPEETKQRLNWWIKRSFELGKRFNHRSSSYWLKHQYEAATGEYVTNDQFKMAMLKAGFKPFTLHDINWCFKIRKAANGQCEGKEDIA